MSRHMQANAARIYSYHREEHDTADMSQHHPPRRHLAPRHRHRHPPRRRRRRAPTGAAMAPHIANRHEAPGPPVRALAHPTTTDQ
ncbi:hypothetical protein GCM10010222_12270 [Streptomyces tanashiensis]|nr:hypothetical protein GCM10010222_12270 [Streptomyces tanashiensis]